MFLDGDKVIATDANGKQCNVTVMNGELTAIEGERMKMLNNALPCDHWYETCGLYVKARQCVKCKAISWLHGYKIPRFDKRGRVVR